VQREHNTKRPLSGKTATFSTSLKTVSLFNCGKVVAPVTEMTLLALIHAN